MTYFENLGILTLFLQKMTTMPLHMKKLSNERFWGSEWLRVEHGNFWE